MRHRCPCEPTVPDLEEMLVGLESQHYERLMSHYEQEQGQESEGDTDADEKLEVVSTRL